MTHLEAEQRACIKCGRPIPADATICEVCNRARMATPSASQYHGTIAVAIIVGVMGLGIAGTLAVRGVGPYRASVLSIEAATDGRFEVSVEVINEGTRAGRANCRLVALDSVGRRLDTVTALSPSIDGGESVVLIHQLAEVDEEPERVSVSCD